MGHFTPPSRSAACPARVHSLASNAVLIPETLLNDSPPRLSATRAAVFAFLFAVLSAPPVLAAPVVPTNFVVEDIAPGAGLNTPTTIAAMPDGRILVGEKQGKVWTIKNGVKSAAPMWSSTPEVLDSYDRGLLSVAVDPNYFVNHFVYFLYTVDPDSNDDETNIESFGRLTRYTVNFTDSATVIPSSRTILLGVDWAHGPLEATGSHTIGCLQFGTDGSLLVSAGDGSDFTVGPDAGGEQPNAFLPGRTDPAEDIGSYRSQYVKSLCGKVLRINPADGHGYASNPFYDGDPTSVRSRVWAYGFRNPYRFTVRPGSGSTNSTAGNPGAIYLGDVGWNDWEEMDVITSGGFNAGWPCHEGPVVQTEYATAAQPTHVTCDSAGITLDDPRPFTDPAVYWHHRLDYAGNFPGFIGNASTAGVFYTDTLYPAQYRGKYFHGDYGQSWLRVATTTAGNQVTAFDLFGSSMDGPVCFAKEPGTGNILYVSIFTNQIRRIRYTGAVGGDTPPVAIATGTPTSGPAPLDVEFDGSQSTDADGDSLTYAWIFGDGGGSSIRNPAHTYTQAGSYLAILTVGDGRGAESRDSVAVLVSPLTTFPSTAVIDDFNRANGPLGAPWQADVAGLAVSSNALVQPSGYGFPIWGGSSFGPDQECFVTIKAITGSASPERDLVLKAQTLSSSTSHIEVRYDDALKQVDVGTYDPVHGWITQGSPLPVTYVAGDRLGARAYGNGVVEVYKNATKVGSRTLVGWPYIDQGGYIGLTLDMSNRGSLDDFGGGDVVFAVNHPPVASMTGPADSSFYFVPDTLKLHGVGTDADEPSAGLQYHWDVFLHHNSHLHIALNFNGQDAQWTSLDHDDGSGVFYEARLIVTDSGGLSDTTSRRFFPEADLHPFAIVTNADHIAPSNPTEFAFRVGNSGRLLAHVSHWALLLDGTALAQGDTIVAPLDTIGIHVLVPGGTFAAGDHDLRVVVDSLRTLVETDESNNVATATFTAPGATTAVDGGRPATLELSNARPNPTRSGAVFALDLPRTGAVVFDVLDLQGRSVWGDAPRTLPAGRWSLAWNGRTRDGTPVAAGVYLARVRIDGILLTRRLAVLR